MRNICKRLLLGFVVTIFVTGVAYAEGFVNGSFETGDYSGWVIGENPVGCVASDGCPDWGTWGIGTQGDIIDILDVVLDYEDNLDVTQMSWCLGLNPLLCEPSDLQKMSLFLHNSAAIHTMYQEVVVPENATALSWEMFYRQFNAFPTEFGINQYLSVSLIDSTTGASELLFMTVNGESPLEIPLTPFSYDITQYRGKTVGVLVELMTEVYYIVAGFDNFRIEVEEVTVDEPTVLKPAWAKGEKKGWKGDTMPPGLVKIIEKKLKGKKGELPPGILKKLEGQMGKGKEAAPGQQKKNK